MTALSKLKDSIYGREWSFPYNCYEVGHGWTPFCTDAACGVGIAAFKNSLPLYSSLYLFTQLGLQRKYNLEAFGETLKSILTSSSFLGFNFFFGIGTSCLLRNNSDRYYYRIQCLLPGFIASYMALLIERPSRRPALAFYLANMSSELLYKWACSHQLTKPLPHGETILFALGMACWMRFVRLHGFGHDPVSTALKFLIGSHEAKSRAKKSIIGHCQQAPGDDEHQQVSAIEGSQLEASNEQTKRSNTTKRPNVLSRLEQQVTEILNLVFAKHQLCTHEGVSCVDYVLTPAMSRFAMGYLARSCLNLVAKFQLIRRHPAQALAESFKSRNSVMFGLFLGTFVGSSKATHCIMRRLTGRQDSWHSALAGAISGLSMLFAPRSTLSTYVLWKCLEQYFFLGVQEGKIKNPDQIICLVYAISTNVLLYIFALEPRFIRPSYMKFIDEISDHKLHQVNRMGKFSLLASQPDGFETKLLTTQIDNNSIGRLWNRSLGGLRRLVSEPGPEIHEQGISRASFQLAHPTLRIIINLKVMKIKEAKQILINAIDLRLPTAKATGVSKI